MSGVSCPYPCHCESGALPLEAISRHVGGRAIGNVIITGDNNQVRWQGPNSFGLNKSLPILQAA